MSDRLLPSDDPVAEEVLEWTIAKDARDVASDNALARANKWEKGQDGFDVNSQGTD